jgi:hypothetical protein
MPQKHKATVQDSTLRVEMNNLEEQADNAKARELFWKPLSWLGAIRPTSAKDAFDPALWETFVSTTLGLEVPTLAAGENGLKVGGRGPLRLIRCVPRAFRNGGASPDVSRSRGRRLQGCPPLECSVRSDELPVSMRMRMCVVM